MKGICDWCEEEIEIGFQARVSGAIAILCQTCHQLHLNGDITEFASRKKWDS